VHSRGIFRPASIPLLGLANDCLTAGPWRSPKPSSRSFLSSEAADALGIPRRTADRRWAFARSLLADALAGR
jgi:hypothetical protein